MIDWFVCRTDTWNGIAQDIDVKAGHVYNFTSMVTFDNTNNKHETFIFTLACKAADGG